VLESSKTQPARPPSGRIAHLFFNYGAEHQLLTKILPFRQWFHGFVTAGQRPAVTKIKPCRAIRCFGSIRKIII
ncbi:MAG: hypothetical protein LBK82_15215, partial [Planctomycetaceae bacterium]|nr:hypothetical protein [Planctomycetaceae bacterium]